MLLQAILLCSFFHHKKKTDLDYDRVQYYTAVLATMEDTEGKYPTLHEQVLVVLDDVSVLIDEPTKSKHFEADDQKLSDDLAELSTMESFVDSLEAI